MSADHLPRASALFERMGSRIHGLCTPALVIDRPAAVHNIAAMVKRVGQVRRWRPHIKTIKQAPLVEALFAAGVTRLKCATALEAQLAVDCARRTKTSLDLLVAYPVAGPNAQAIVELRRRGPDALRISLLADDPEHLAELDQLCRSSGVKMGVFVDVDLGMGRTGQPPATWAASKAAFDALQALHLRGLHGYDGHHRDADEDAANAGYDQLIGLAEDLRGDREGLLELITSGTHSYVHALTHPGLSSGDAEGRFAHAVSPGTIVLADRRSQAAIEDLGLRQAAFVLTRVISKTADRVTLDCGSKGLAPDTPPESFSALDHPTLEGRRRSEEHLVCEAHLGALPARGELLWVVPEHVCTTVNMYRQAVHLLDDGSIETVQVIAASRLPWGLSA